MLTHVVIEDASGLRALSAEWASLLERSAANEITCHPEWMLGWWDVFGSEGARSVRAIAFYEGAMLVGLAHSSRDPSRIAHDSPFAGSSCSRPAKTRRTRRARNTSV